jgi:hypothetical protein
MNLEVILPTDEALQSFARRGIFKLSVSFPTGEPLRKVSLLGEEIDENFLDDSA